MKVSIDRDVLLDFFVTFACFELALKNAGFFQQRPQSNPLYPPDARPDWDTFAVSLRSVFSSKANAELHEACEYLLSNPPWREVIVNGVLMWRADGPPLGLLIGEAVLLLIRRLRNNLFHGGSFSPVQGYDTLTTESLLRASVLVLVECLQLSPKVRAAFEDAAL